MTRRALICVAVLALVMAASTASASAASGDSAEPRIVGGQTTTIEEYPWQAAIVVQGGGTAFSRQFCGGSLLTTQIVITAAHCLEDDPDCSGPACLLPGQDPGGDGTEEIDPNDINVVLGVTTLSLAVPGDEYAVLNDPGAVSIHPDWDTNTLQNDVGYIVLAAPVTETTTIKTIDIAGDDEASVWAPGMFVEISGWGTTIPGQSSSKSNTLRAGSVPMVDDTTCGDPGVYGSDFDPLTMVCAGYPGGGVDTCQGDSGGPLEAPLEASSDYRLIGITSWGFGCAQPNAPGVYTRIAQAAPGGLRDDVQSAVDALEVAYTLTDEPIVGSGGQPKSGGPKYPLPQPPPPPPPPPLLQTGSTAAPPDPYRKCRKIFNKQRRKKCTKKVRRSLTR